MGKSKKFRNKYFTGTINKKIPITKLTGVIAIFLSKTNKQRTNNPILIKKNVSASTISRNSYPWNIFSLKYDHKENVST